MNRKSLSLPNIRKKDTDTSLPDNRLPAALNVADSLCAPHENPVISQPGASTPLALGTSTMSTFIVAESDLIENPTETSNSIVSSLSFSAFVL